MLGKRSGVAKQIQECQPKAHITHCHGHFLGLSVKDATNNSKILSDNMNNTNEIVKLVRYSPKRENLLGELKSNLIEDDDAKQMDLLSSVPPDGLFEQSVSKEFLITMKRF